ncbi:MAG: hypothetical protein HY923_07650 [Elusimicrobia bacterium]|nr:hypothetical protein [Elusimicrobiota bacterium]
MLRLRKLEPAMADEYLSLKADVYRLIPSVLKDESELPVVSADMIAEFDRRLHLIHDRAGLIDTTKVSKEDVEAADLAYSFIWLRVSLLCVRSSPVDFKELSGALTVLESGAEQLDRDTRFLSPGASAATKGPFTRRLNALNAYGTQIWNRLQANALNVADMGSPVSETPGRKGGAPKYEPNIIGRLRLDINPLQKRVADLSRKLQTINDRLWGVAPVLGDPKRQSEALRARMNSLLHDPFARTAAADGGTSGGVARAVFYSEPLVVTALAPKAEGKTLLDMARVPSPGVAEVPDVSGPKPAVFAGARGRDSAPKQTAEVNALRKQGRTRTIGDPGRRAAYVYHQEGGTCGIGAQIQVLADAGVVSADSAALKAKEDELYARALRLGYFEGSTGDPKRRENGGTANQRVGDLLDMPVRKHFAAKDEELFEAVKGGRMIIVGADTERLWNDRRFRGGGHFVAITGAEVDRKSGKPLGYYINDTGTNEGGRFITLKQFNAAWHRHSRMFVEPL